MSELAECGTCGEGVLLPFNAPEGYVVYYCSRCRARFSGYAVEPLSDGGPVFSDSAVYSQPSAASGVPESELMDSYRDLLERYPPENGKKGECPYCGSELPDGSSVCTECWIPAP